MLTIHSSKNGQILSVLKQAEAKTAAELSTEFM